MKISGTEWTSWGTGVLLLVAVGYNFYYVGEMARELGDSNSNLASNLAKVQTLQQELDAEREAKDALASSLQSEKERNDSFANQLEDFSDTVGTLEKIKNTDPELLRKYSKVYFLNENYIPKRLSQIKSKYLFDPDKDQYFQAEVIGRLTKMLEAAMADDIPLRVASAYRSFDTQADLKTGYSVVYGTGANAFSADQGYSEHQLGTTVDLILPTLTSLSTNFDQTEAYDWLTKNAYKYGFVLSYPKGNAYYQFEPWHWRFVGLRLAKYLHNEDKNFYDLDQRQIDEYRAQFFD